MPNTTKIPCGGFRIGDGLAMDGDTLKSLGGAYVKVINNGETFEFMDDSPLKTFEEIRQKVETSPITLLMYSPDSVFGIVHSCFFNDYFSGEIDSISFCAFGGIIENSLSVEKVSIDSDNKITVSKSRYTLTPTT